MDETQERRTPRRCPTSVYAPAPATSTAIAPPRLLPDPQTMRLLAGPIVAKARLPPSHSSAVEAGAPAIWPRGRRRRSEACPPRSAPSSRLDARGEGEMVGVGWLVV